MVSTRKEIPSSLDLLPLGERFGDKNLARKRARPNPRFQHVKSSIDTGKRPKKTMSDAGELARLAKMKGENYSRMAPQALAQKISLGDSAIQLNQSLSES